MLRPAHVYFLSGVLLFSITSHAQYKGDDILGFLGLQSGTQVPRGLYVGKVVWVYPTIEVQEVVVSLYQAQDSAQFARSKQGFRLHRYVLSPITFWWHRKRPDFASGYNLYLPTERFSATGTGNTCLGHYGNEFFLGTTVYLDQKKLRSAAGTFAREFHTNKKGTNINVGDMAT